jgi:integrase/recombinase XerD
MHAAMFDRFARHLRAKSMTLTICDSGHVESFFADVDTRCAPGTTKRVTPTRQFSAGAGMHPQAP